MKKNMQKKLFVAIVALLMLVTLPLYSYLKNARTSVETAQSNSAAILSLDTIQQMDSWDELVSKAVPEFPSAWDNVSNLEDMNCIWFIKSLRNTQTDVLAHDLDIYVVLSLSLKDIDYDSLMSKFKAIVDIYNSSNSLALSWKSEIINDKYFKVEYKICQNKTSR